MSRQAAAAICRCVLAVIFLVGTVLMADSWLLPKPTRYYSLDKRYCFEVVPKRLESQLKYFQDKVAGREDAGSPEGAVANVCRGTLYKKGRLWTRKRIWSVRLANEVAPVDALVADNGNHVVTFDNWGAIGYGDDVIVIYGIGGRLIKKFSLEGLLGRDVDNVAHSVSSRHWAGDQRARYLDEPNRVLVVKAVLVDTVRFGPIVATKKDAKPHIREIKISLEDGTILSAN